MRVLVGEGCAKKENTKLIFGNDDGCCRLSLSLNLSLGGVCSFLWSLVWREWTPAKYKQSFIIKNQKIETPDTGMSASTHTAHRVRRRSVER
jgi:hypothetical protein